MRPVQSWLDEYGESHRTVTNKSIHWICVPLIMLSIIGLVWCIPVPGAWVTRSTFLNWGVLLVIAALIYYYTLAWRLAFGMTVVSAVMIFIVYGVSLSAAWPWLVWAIVFVLAWIGQFIGHRVEGRKPSFFKDLQFLLIGPLWLLAFVYRRAQIAY
ncbi:MAG TPA: Mpo1-like protein [Gammaproteobacteria bacterium]|nr:Mpo1-like protein [Gammaproteobacteria bacterium]